MVEVEAELDSLVELLGRLLGGVDILLLLHDHLLSSMVNRTTQHFVPDLLGHYELQVVLGTKS